MNTTLAEPHPQIDPVTLSVILNRFKIVATEMTLTLEQTAHTSILALARDFSCAIYDADARQVMVHDALPIHTTSMDMVLRGIVEAFSNDVHEGDVFLCNDPAHGNTHVGDLVAARPVFVGDRLCFWSVARGHQMDTGAFIATSVSAAPRNVWQEGLTIPPTRLYERGQLRRDILRLYLSNVRYQDALEGDLMAEIGSIEVGARRLSELCAEYGAETVLEYVDAIIAYAGRRMAVAIREIQDGVYEGDAWVDGDGVDREDVLVHVAVRVEDDRVEVDFSGSAPQGRGGINGSAATARATATVPFLCYVDSDIPHNEGCLSRIEVTAPAGTICNARWPASTSTATVVPSDAMHDAINKAMAAAVPHAVRAGSARGGNIPQLFGEDPETGEPWAAMMFTGGAHGAAKGVDGWPLIQTLAAMGGEKALSIEQVELLYPLLLEQMEIETDSMGAGEWIGGPGIRVVLRSLAGEMSSVAFGDGFRNPPHGVLGGRPGIGGGQYVERTDGARTFVSSCGAATLEDGAAWVSVATGGGGYGRPIDRDPDAVRRDVRDELISPKTARDVFGVVLTDGFDPDLDREATERLRLSMADGQVHLISPSGPGAGTWLESQMRPGDEYVTEAIPPEMAE